MRGNILEFTTNGEPKADDQEWPYVNTTVHGLLRSIDFKAVYIIEVYKDGEMLAHWSFSRNFKSEDSSHTKNDPNGYFDNLSEEDWRCPDGVDPCPPMTIEDLR